LFGGVRPGLVDRVPRARDPFRDALGRIGHQIPGKRSEHVAHSVVVGGDERNAADQRFERRVRQAVVHTRGHEQVDAVEELGRRQFVVERHGVQHAHRARVLAHERRDATAVGKPQPRVRIRLQQRCQRVDRDLPRPLGVERSHVPDDRSRAARRALEVRRGQRRDGRHVDLDPVFVDVKSRDQTAP